MAMFAREVYRSITDSCAIEHRVEDSKLFLNEICRRMYSLSGVHWPAAPYLALMVWMSHSMPSLSPSYETAEHA